ncbi:NADPH oxidase 5 [Eurytemora carolleeae]|uniref:NADPH oxidase 5 n=1 Tax=Eurytemora carolleeae TaxID=1294199 RepID=UPI000C78CC75|nr:NADPH oxidase 5 [Eurytemora carolleeae]|eukprot:XP_023339065.1 NADPH oxidase 5-like [Eurytemora affinis]
MQVFELWNMNEKNFKTTTVQTLLESSESDVNSENCQVAATLFYLQTDRTKVRFIFDEYDRNLNGILTKEEMQATLQQIVTKISFQIEYGKIQEMAKVMVEDMIPDDSSENQSLTFKIFYDYVQKRVLLKKYILKVLEPQFDDVKKTKQGEPVKQSYFSVDYFQNNSQHVATVVLFLIFLLIMMIARALQFTSSLDQNGDLNWWVMVSRSTGQGCSILASTMTVLVCKPLITFMRNQGLHRILPLDLHIFYHKWCGMLLAVLSLIHTLSHVANFYINILPDPNIFAANNDMSVEVSFLRRIESLPQTLIF